MIKFIYFDVGGVVIKDLSGTNHWADLKAELGVTHENEQEFMDIWQSFEKDVVVGRNVQEIIQILIKRLRLDIGEDYSLLNGFVSRFRQNQSIWPIIADVQKQIPTGLLTNMYPGMLTAIEERDLLPPVKWNTVVDSAIEKVAKPDSAIFELAEEQANAHGQEVLFIDNTAGHLEAASAFGWQTYFYDATDYKKSSIKLQTYFIGAITDQTAC